MECWYDRTWCVFRKGKRSGLIKTLGTFSTEAEAKTEMKNWREFHKAVGDTNYTFRVGIAPGKRMKY